MRLLQVWVHLSLYSITISNMHILREGGGLSSLGGEEAGLDEHLLQQIATDIQYSFPHLFSNCAYGFGDQTFTVTRFLQSTVGTADNQIANCNMHAQGVGSHR